MIDVRAQIHPNDPTRSALTPLTRIKLRRQIEGTPRIALCFFRLVFLFPARVGPAAQSREVAVEMHVNESRVSQLRIPGHVNGGFRSHVNKDSGHVNNDS